MLGLTISGGNVEVASVYQSIGHGTAKALRFATQSLFDKVVARASGNAQQLEKDWRTLQERSVRNNIQVKTFEEVYGKDLTEKLGISRAEIARLNKEAGAYEANRLASHGGSLTPTSIQQPAPPTARPLGGVELKAIAQLKGDSLPATLTGLVFDEATKRFVLIGDAPLNLPHLTEADLAMALWLVYGPNARDPQFSLDPADPRNPEGKWLKAVYLPEDLKGSGFGETMFIADFLLKQYGFSVRVTESGSIVERKVGVPGFKSLPDMVKGTPSLHAPQWARKWIVSDELKLQRNESGNSLYFDTIKMAVKAKRQIPDPSSKTGLRDIETPLDSVETRWAEMFTERFARIGQEESPEFLRLVELAKAIGIAKFLKQRKIEVDMNWVIQTLNKNRVKATDKVTALSVTWKSEQQKPFNDSRGQGIQTTIETIRLFGGVDLTVRPKYTEDSQTAMAQRQLVTSATKKDPAAPVFTIENLNKVEYAKVLPMISVGSQANQRGWAFDRQWR